MSLICVGPLTNIALCLKMYPQSQENLKDLYIMGGNYEGVGNITKAAEFNTYTDPEAAYIVLDSLSTKIPTFIVPWEACKNERFHIDLEWRLKVLGAAKNNFLALLNPAEEKCYKSHNSDGWSPCDCILVAAFLDPSIVLRQRSCHVTVELAGNHTRGQFVVDHLSRATHNVIIYEFINVEQFKKMAFIASGQPFEYEVKGSTTNTNGMTINIM